MTQYPEAWLCRELGMAVVNISLITDYDAGVHEGTEAVNATNVLEVFQENAARIQEVVLDLIGRFPADLDALGARAALGPTRGDGHAIVGRGHPAVRDRPVTATAAGRRRGALPDRRLPPLDPRRARLVARERPPARRGGLRRGLVLGPLHGPRRPDRAGRGGLDDAVHGRRRDERVTVAPFVLNVMNRHPALVARMASTLQVASGGRLILGIGIGGAPKEHAAYGMDFPEAPERVARLEEAVAVIRALWTGGPVTRDSPFYPLRDAYAHPVPTPAPPIIIGGETPAGARLAARIGDGWTTFDDNFEANLPLYLEALEASGRRREDQQVLVGFQGDWLGDETIRTRRGSARRARPGSAGRRPAPTARSSSPGRPTTSTRWSRPSGAGRPSPPVRGTIGT